MGLFDDVEPAGGTARPSSGGLYDDVEPATGGGGGLYDDVEPAAPVPTTAAAAAPAPKAGFLDRLTDEYIGGLRDRFGSLDDAIETLTAATPYGMARDVGRDIVGQVAGSLGDTFEEGGLVDRAVEGTYEWATDREYVDEDAIAKMDRETARQTQRRQSNIVANTGRDVVDLGKGLAELAGQGVDIGAAVVDGRFADAGRQALGLGRALGEEAVVSVARNVRDPIGYGTSNPLEAVGNASLGAGALARGSALAAGKGWQAGKAASRAAQKSLAPTTLLRRGVDAAVDAPLGGVKTRAAAQWLVDQRAGIDARVRGLIDDARRARLSKSQRRVLDAVKDTGLEGLKPAQRKKLWEVLSADNVVRVMPDYVEAQYRLLDDAEALIGKVGDDAFDAARRQGAAAVDALRAEVLGKTDDLAQRVDGMRPLYEVEFLHRGKPMSGIEFLLDKGEIDAGAITINLDKLTDPFLREQANNMLAIRRTLQDLANEAQNIDVGTGRGLLSSRTQRAHAARYLPDVYRDTDKTGNAAFVRLLDPTKADEVGWAKRAEVKHIHEIEKRVALGALPPERIADALTVHIGSATRAVEKFKLFEMLGKGPERIARTADELTDMGLKVRDNVAVRPLTAKKAAGAALETATRRHSKALIRERFAHQRGKGEAAAAENLRKASEALDAAQREYDRIGQPLSKAERQKWVRVPDDTADGVPVYGALAGQFVDAQTYNAVKKIARAEQGLRRLILDAVSAWKTSKVVLNPPSHLNQLADNVLKQVFDGANPAKAPVEVGRAVWRLTRKKAAQTDPFIRAATREGILGDAVLKSGDTLSDVSGLGAWVRARREDLRALSGSYEEAARGLLSAYHGLLMDTAPGRGAQRVWQLSDDASRLSLFERWVRRTAKETGRSVDDVLRSRDDMAEAARHVEGYHFTYDDAPLLVETLDRYGVLPFGRYSQAAARFWVDRAALNPVLAPATARLPEVAYDAADARGKEQRDLQPPWTLGRAVPLPNLSRLVDKDVGLNARYLVPVPLPGDLIGAEKGGSYDQDLIDEPTRFVPGGPTVGTAIEFLLGKSLEFGRDLDQLPGLASEFVRLFGFDGEALKGRPDYLLGQVAPGAAYHGLKVLRAGAGQKDTRGREMSVAQAMLHAAGLKVEDLDPQRVRRGIRMAADRAKSEAKAQRKREMRQARDAAERKEAQERFARTMKAINRRVKELERGM